MGKGRGRTAGGGGGIVVAAASRKAQRKEARLAKKKRPHQSSATTTSEHRAEVAPAAGDTLAGNSKKKRRERGADADAGAAGAGKRVKFSAVVEEKSIPSVKNKIPTGLKKSRTSIAKESPIDHFDVAAYDHFDDETAAAFRKDDIEIQYLESELGIKGKKGSKRGARELNREYAKNEGFGDGFGEFLMGLDDLVGRCVGDGEVGIGGESEEGGGSSSSDGSEDEKVKAQLDSDEEESDADNGYNGEDPYAGLDEETALAFRGDDAEIAQLEEKLGLSTSKKAKKKLRKEFASTFAGYGEDFGDFLEGLDGLGARVGLGAIGGDEGSVDGGSVGSEPLDSDDDDRRDREELHGPSASSEESEEDSESEESAQEEADHDASLTYRPASGEDIYGNKLDASGNDAPKPTKYVPPHLRKKLAQEGTNDADNDPNQAIGKSAQSDVAEADPETIRRIQRSLNSQLNRLSEQTLESVSKAIAGLYSQYPFHDLNDCLWKNVRTACVPPHMVMSGLIPLYIGAVAGVHWLGGDGVQLGGCLVEWSVAKLHEALTRARAGGSDAQEGEHEKVNKEASNLLLIVCYLYNYGVVHCTVVYDLVRDFIARFSEIDVEALLLVLGHCGQQLRSDDPSALREIVLLVKERAQKVEAEGDGDVADSSRVQYLVDGILELKNNKPRKQDVVLREKTNALRKCVGRVKSAASHSLAGKKSGSCLRVSLRDILDAETKGRWWIAGAQWAGNQYRGDEDDMEDGALSRDADKGKPSSSKTQTEEDGLLTLAASQRMNTDARRSIFCTIMGSADCDDAFEKLVRQGLLKPKAERDVVRVIVHCCGEEKAFNPFYAYLALRVCEYQHKSRFTLMLTFADAFKQLEACSVRKAANLAKLMAHLVGAQGKCLTIGVLKRIDFSPSDMPEMVVVFLSVFFTALFEYLDVEDVERIFGQGLAGSSSKPSKRHVNSDDEDDGRDKAQATKKEDLRDLRESLSVFLLQYLKSSPKNVKGSSFHANYAAAQKACGSS
ncbi:hypothetical protein ACHAXT_008359 [Thalassiosira profunda]